MHWLYAGLACTLYQFWLFTFYSTMQINSRATEIVIYFGSKVAICMGDEFD